MTTSSFDSVSSGNLTLQALRQTLRQEAFTYSGIPQAQAVVQSALADQGPKVELQTSTPDESAAGNDPHRGHLVNISS